MSLSSEQLSALSLLARGYPPSHVASELGISERTLFRWKKLPEFDAAASKIGKTTTQTVIEETAADLSDLALEHLQAHKAVRALASKALLAYQQKLDAGADVEELNVRQIALWSTMLDRHIAGERVAASLDYLNVDKAIDYLTSQGYQVSIPGEDKSEISDSSLM